MCIVFGLSYVFSHIDGLPLTPVADDQVADDQVVPDDLSDDTVYLGEGPRTDRPRTARAFPDELLSDVMAYLGDEATDEVPDYLSDDTVYLGDEAVDRQVAMGRRQWADDQVADDEWQWQWATGPMMSANGQWQWHWADDEWQWADDEWQWQWHWQWADDQWQWADDDQLAADHPGADI